jgi:synaptobrevin homolog YKT6
MTVFAKTVAERTKPGVRQDVEEKQYTFHAYASSLGVCGIIISDPSYPKMVAHTLLSKMVDEFTSVHPRSQYSSPSVGLLDYPQLKEYIIKYQNPEEVDSIMKIQQELDATKVWTFSVGSPCWNGWMLTFL